MRRLRGHLSFANVCSFLALMIAVGTGGAYAANTIGSSDIIDGQVKTADLGANAVNSSKLANGEVQVADIGQGAVATEEIANNQVKATDIGDGEVKSAEIANGQVQTAEIGADQVRGSHVLNDNLTGADIATNALKGADIDEATLDIGDTARAYAWVRPDFCTGTPGTCPPQQAKGISDVTREATGTYCVIAPGIDSADVSPAVTVDWSSTGGPEGNASAMTGEVGCGGGGFQVFTERQPQVNVDSGGGTSNQVVNTAAVFDNDVGFTIVIP